MNTSGAENPAEIAATEKQSGFFENSLLQMIVIAVLGLVVYANTFLVPFVFDDFAQIMDNPVIRSLANFFLNDSGYDYNSNRFIGYLSFALNYHFGGLNVVGFHVVNLGIHIANGLLVYSLVRLTFCTPFFTPLIPQSFVGLNSTLSSQPSSINPQVPLLIPLITALLFVCHPIQTQAVTYIVQRLTSLATLFFLASLVLHIRWRLAREAGSPFMSKAVLPRYFLSLVSAVLAMKTKEIAFTLPIIVLIYEVCFFGLPDRKRLIALLPIFLSIFIIPLTMVSIHKPIGEILSDVSSATVVDSRLSRWEYLFTQFSVIVTYLRLLVLPVNQNLDYDYPANHSLFEPRALLALLALLTLFTLALYLWRASARTRRQVVENSIQGACSTFKPQLSSAFCPPLLRLASFGILWFFITLMVESSFVPIIDVIYEHRVYLPATGGIMALVVLASVALRSMPPKVVAAFFAVLICTFSVGTFLRNMAWRDNVSLWQDVTAKSPNKARAWGNLGVALSVAGRGEESIGALNQALRLRPDYPSALYNLGRVYLEFRNDPMTAISLLNRAITAYPQGMEAYKTLGLAYIRAGQADQALETYRKALRINPDSGSIRYNLANTYADLGRFGEAIQEYQAAIALNPNNFAVYNNLAVTYIKQGNMDGAIEAFSAAARLRPGDIGLKHNLAMAYMKRGMHREAAEVYRAILKIDPNDMKSRVTLQSVGQ